MRELWQYWSGVLSDHRVNRIIEVGESYPVAEAALGFDGKTKSSGTRTSEIRWIHPYDDGGQEVQTIVRRFAEQANKNAFGFEADYIPDLQYTKYSASDNGHYDWHIDTFWANPTAFDRKISVVIQLSDPNDYEGGDFMIDRQYPQPNPEEIKKKGSIIVFPSFIPHCVTPITKGERRSLVSWVQGPKFR